MDAAPAASSPKEALLLRGGRASALAMGTEGQKQRGKERFERQNSSISTAAPSVSASPPPLRTHNLPSYSAERPGLEEPSTGIASINMREAGAPLFAFGMQHPGPGYAEPGGYTTDGHTAGGRPGVPRNSGMETDISTLVGGLYAGAVQGGLNNGSGLPQQYGLLGAAPVAYAPNLGMAQELFSDGSDKTLSPPYKYGAGQQQQYYYPSMMVPRDPGAYYFDGNAGPLLKASSQPWGLGVERGGLERGSGMGSAPPVGFGFAGGPASVYESLVAPAPFLDAQKCFSEDPSFDLAALPRMTSEEIASQQTTALRYQQDAQSQVVVAYRKALDVIQQQQMAGFQYEESMEPARDPVGSAEEAQEEEKITPVETPSVLDLKKSAGGPTPRMSTTNTPQSDQMAAVEKTHYYTSVSSSKSRMSSASGLKPPSRQADPAIRESHFRDAARRETGKKKGRGTRKPIKGQQGDVAGRGGRNDGSSPPKRSGSKRGRRRSDPSPQPVAGEYERRGDTDSEATVQHRAQETPESVSASEVQRYAISNKEMIDAYLKAQERALKQKQFIHQLPINKQMEYTGSASLPPGVRVDLSQEMQRRNGVAALPHPNGCASLPFSMTSYAEQSCSEGSMDIGPQKLFNSESFAGSPSYPSSLQQYSANWAPQAYPYNGAFGGYSGPVPSQAIYPNPLMAGARTQAPFPPASAGGALYLGGGPMNGPRNALPPPWSPEMPVNVPVAACATFPSFRSMQSPSAVPSPPFQGVQDVMAPMFPSLGATLQRRYTPGGATASTRMPSAMAQLVHSSTVADAASMRETRPSAAGKTKWFSFFGKGGNTRDEEHKRVDTNGPSEEDGGRQRRGRSFLGCLTPAHARIRSPFSLFGPSSVPSTFGEPPSLPAAQGMQPMSSLPANPSG